MRRGFTLLELMVALSLGGVTLVSASLFVQQLTDTGSQIARTSVHLDSSENGERLLRALVSQFEHGPDSHNAFSGSVDRVALDTWCNAPAGWKERCKVELRFDTLSSGLALVLAVGHEAPIRLRDGLHDGRLAFLREAANGGSWMSSWGPAVAGPLAIRLTLNRDTLFLRMGERR